MGSIDKMHIAILIGSLKRGGAERVLVNLADYLIAHGHDITMVTTYQMDVEYTLNPAAKRVISDITPEETTNSRVVNFIRRFFKLRRIWKTEKPDVILSFIGKNNFMTILTTVFIPVITVVAVRGEPWEEYYKRWMRFFARFFFRFASGVVLQTTDSLSFFGKRVQRKVKILRNPLNPIFLKPRYEGVRDKVIVTAARMDDNKNQALLIRAYALIADLYPDYRLVIYGDGVNRQKLENLTRELNLQDKVDFMGNVDNIPDVIYKARVFVLPSSTEGMPNILIEAMTMGLTCISTDCPCGGPAELIDDGVNGLLTPVGDPEKMAENLQKVLNDLQMADELGRKATKTGDIYHPDTICGEWEVYLDLLVKTKLKKKHEQG